LGISDSTPSPAGGNPGTTAGLDSSPEPGTCDLFTTGEDPTGWWPGLWVEERTPSGWLIRETTFTLNGYKSVDVYSPWGGLVWRGVR
jgi:hypothetical protein